MSKKTFRPMRALVLAGVLSLAAVSAAQAGGKVTGSEFHSGASAAPACDGISGTQKKAEDGLLSRDWCRMIAGDTGPGGPGDDTGRTGDIETTHPLLAGDGGPGTAGDNNGRSAALITDDGRAVLADDTGPTSAGEHNGRSAALTTGDWHPV